jgi:choline dehydrogenase-like flavoprotein
MCHIAGTIGTLRISRPADHVWQGYERAEDGVYCRRRITLTDEAQRREAIGNAVFRLHHPRIPDPHHHTGALSAIFLARRFISYEYGKRLATAKPLGAQAWMRHVANATFDSPATLRFLHHWLRERILAERKFPSVIVHPRRNLFSLDFNVEQSPNPDSHVRLTEQTDALGMPRLLIDWRYSTMDVRTVATAFRLLQRDFARSTLGELTVDPDEEDIETVIRRDGAYGGHHIGTTRMGRNPTEGVVDANCRIFDIRNLYVTGSAIFPTSGQANPTLTIVALAIRLARHLEDEARRAAEVRITAPSRPPRACRSSPPDHLLAETMTEHHA